MWDHVRTVVSWLVSHAQAVVTALAAIAAMFSALSAFFSRRIQRDNLRESVRPELVLLGWSRTPPAKPGGPDIIIFTAIKNVGRGSAFNIWIQADPAGMTTRRFSLLAVNDEITVGNGHIAVWLTGEVAAVTVKVTCWDSRRNEYETRYLLTVISLSHPSMLIDPIAPGVIDTRTTIMRPAWWLKWRGRFRRPWYWFVNRM